MIENFENFSQTYIYSETSTISYVPAACNRVNIDLTETPEMRGNFSRFSYGIVGFNIVFQSLFWHALAC